jgi:thioredoxin 1
MALDATSETFFDALEHDGIVVADFYKEDCEPCQKFFKIMPRVETALAEVGANIVKVNVEQFPEFVSMYELDKVPTFLYFKEGQEVTRHFGIKSIAEMTKIITTL